MPRSALCFAGIAGTVAAVLLVSVPTAAQRDALQEANQLFREGQYERALERVEAHLKTTPRDARGRFLKGLIFAEQRKPNEAIKVFTELTQEFPELPEPYNNLAVLYASQGQYEKARSALEMAIRTHPSYATAHENLGDIYAKMASQAYDKALQIDKANSPLQTKLNLIKDIFVGSSRPPKPEGTKPESAKLAVAAPVQKPPAPVTQPQQSAAPAPVAAKPAPAKPQAKPAAKPSGNPEEVLNTVSLWAKAWSENDVGGYLAHYATDFKTPNGEPRGSWEAQRKARIAKPRKIQVDVESPKVVFNDNGRVTVTFRQHYRSDALNVTSSKTLVMVKAGDRWLIQLEKVGG
ncbi:MAG TPA: tetratricopeptide repeat protein [Burkholderiales bacterium]|jgi:tetratricopeptide (TPR) repeat protein